MSQPRRDATDVQRDAEFATGTVLPHKPVLATLTSYSHR
jgi:hypothetical protein